MLLRLYLHWRSSYLGIPRNIWFLAFVNLVNRMGGMVISFITIYLTQQLHFDIRQAGYVMGCFGVGAFAGAFLGGKLTDKIGYYQVQFWSLILNGLMLLLLMTVRDFWPMCGAVFTLSLVSELFRPANSVAIARYAEPETRTRSISLMRMAFNLGWTIAPALGGLLAALGWNWLFWVDGLTCIMAALLLRRLLPPKPAVETPIDDLKEKTPLKEISAYRDRRFLAFVFLTAIGGMVFMQFMWTVPVFFKETYHWNEAQIGIMVALNGLIVFLVEMPLIFRIEGKRPGLQYVRLGLIMYAAAYLCFVTPMHPLSAALLFITIISMGEIFVMPFSSNFMYKRAGKGNQGQYSALYTMSYSVANILAPLLGTQVIAAWGYHTLWYLLGVLSTLALGGFWWLERNDDEL